MILGKVISALTWPRKQKGKAAATPFRESKLTFLFQNALGGNTKTSMIAELLPANINHDETLSTLRYVWQVKAIKIRPRSTRILKISLSESFVKNWRHSRKAVEEDPQVVL